MINQFVMNGIRLGAYGPLKRLFGHENGSSEVIIRNIAAGAASGVLGSFFGSPFQMVKVRLQTQSRANASGNAVGHQHHYRNIWHGLSTVFYSEGLTGLFRGVDGAMVRVGIGSAIQLSTYDTVKFQLIKADIIRDNFMGHIVSSFVAGFMVTVLMNPFDVVSTRLYNQAIRSPISSATSQSVVRYSGPLDCLMKTAKTEGLRGLYKGFFPHYLRLGPHTILTLVFWEQFKKLTKPFFS